MRWGYVEGKTKPNMGYLDVVKEKLRDVGAREDEVCDRTVNILIRGIEM